MSRYQITRRLDPGAPSDRDPKATIPLPLAVYDLRDMESGSVIVGSGTKLSALRELQARLNTKAACYL